MLHFHVCMYQIIRACDLSVSYLVICYMYTFNCNLYSTNNVFIPWSDQRLFILCTLTYYSCQECIMGAAVRKVGAGITHTLNWILEIYT